MGWETFNPDSPPGDSDQCTAEFSRNIVFEISLTIGYFWITLIIMCCLYLGIYRVALNLQKRSDAKRRKMASLVSMAGQTISKIGVSLTQNIGEVHILSHSECELMNNQQAQHAKQKGNKCFYNNSKPSVAPPSSGFDSDDKDFESNHPCEDYYDMEAVKKKMQNNSAGIFHRPGWQNERNRPLQYPTNQAESQNQNTQQLQNVHNSHDKNYQAWPARLVGQDNQCCLGIADHLETELFHLTKSENDFYSRAELPLHSAYLVPPSRCPISQTLESVESFRLRPRETASVAAGCNFSDTSSLDTGPIDSGSVRYFSLPDSLCGIVSPFLADETRRKGSTAESSFEYDESYLVGQVFPPISPSLHLTSSESDHDELEKKFIWKQVFSELGRVEMDSCTETFSAKLESIKTEITAVDHLTGGKNSCMERCGLVLRLEDQPIKIETPDQLDHSGPIANDSDYLTASAPSSGASPQLAGHKSSIDDICHIGTARSERKVLPQFPLKPCNVQYAQQLDNSGAMATHMEVTEINSKEIDNCEVFQGISPPSPVWKSREERELRAKLFQERMRQTLMQKQSNVLSISTKTSCKERTVVNESQTYSSPQ
ncbi:unnamed protein product, partial [Protopolystoma xenopodis]